MNKKSAPLPRVDSCLARHGSLSYLEVPTLDPLKSAIFYEKVCGWKIEQRDTNDFRFAEPSGQLIGSFKTGGTISRKPGLLPYIYISGVKKAMKCVTKFGGKIVKPPYNEGNLLVAIIRDPAGNLIGLWEQASS
jgi:uncharacterized protein